MRNQKGFTLIELVLVITILGILAVSALPNFVNMTTQAETSSMNGVVGAVRAGVSLVRANDMVTSANPALVTYTATLGDGTANTACGTSNLCFETVVNGGISDASWTPLTAGTVYQFTNGATTTCFTYGDTDGNAGVPAGGFQQTDCPE